MASITISARASNLPQLRPLSILRDLPAVADLIELCFSSTMDGEGKRYIQDMRRAGSDRPFLKWAGRMAESTSLPLTGYVWEENGRIVGNASLVPFRHLGQRIYLIANVAVHPDFRRRGIGRRLTEHAMSHARERKTHAIWLQVRDDNPNAIDLYQSLGFVERARRTSWQAATSSQAPRLEADISLQPRHPRFWALQQAWLNRIYPQTLAWHRHVSLNSLQPGFWSWLYGLVMDVNIRQWAAVREGQLHAVVAWFPRGREEALYAAVGDGSDPQALTALLLQARRDLSALHPNIQMEFPHGEMDGAILSAGFRPLRTLIWMQAT
jgi:ribosomal protein S18 acetylase RimI-like enzyme